MAAERPARSGEAHNCTQQVAGWQARVTGLCCAPPLRVLQGLPLIYCITCRATISLAVRPMTFMLSRAAVKGSGYQSRKGLREPPSLASVRPGQKGIILPPASMMAVVPANTMRSDQDRAPLLAGNLDLTVPRS